MRDRLRFAGRQDPVVVRQPVSGAGGIAAADADPVVEEAAEAAVPSKHLNQHFVQ